MKLHSGFIGFIATGCLLMSPVIAGGAIQQSTPRARPVVGLIDEVQEFYPDTKLDQPVKQLTDARGKEHNCQRSYHDHRAPRDREDRVFGVGRQRYADIRGYSGTG